MRRCSICPRCNLEAYEVLKSHSFCSGCDFSPEFLSEYAELTIPKWIYERFPGFLAREKRARRRNLLGGAI